LVDNYITCIVVRYRIVSRQIRNRMKRQKQTYTKINTSLPSRKKSKR